MQRHLIFCPRGPPLSHDCSGPLTIYLPTHQHTHHRHTISNGIFEAEYERLVFYTSCEARGPQSDGGRERAGRGRSTKAQRSPRQQSPLRISRYAINRDGALLPCTSIIMKDFPNQNSSMLISDFPTARQRSKEKVAALEETIDVLKQENARLKSIAVAMNSHLNELKKQKNDLVMQQILPRPTNPNAMMSYNPQTATSSNNSAFSVGGLGTIAVDSNLPFVAALLAQMTSTPSVTQHHHQPRPPQPTIDLLHAFGLSAPANSILASDNATSEEQESSGKCSSSNSQPRNE